MSEEMHESHRLLTVPEVAERLRLTKGTVYRLIRAGIVPAVQLGAPGASLRVAEAELQEWLFESSATALPRREAWVSPAERPPRRPGRPRATGPVTPSRR